MAGRWNGTKGSGWSFNAKDYSEYITNDEVYNLIQEFDKNKLHEFTEIEQIKLASFVLNYNKHEGGYANEQEALQLLNKWKIEEDEH